eukprot:g15373.t1
MLSALEIRALAEEVKALDDEGDDFPVVVPTRPSHPSRRVEPVERTARAVVRRGPVVILGGDRGSGSSVEPGRRPDGIVSGQENSRPETSGGAPTPEENTNTRGTSEPAAAARSTHASRTKGSYGNYNTPQEDGRSNSKPDAGRTTASAKSRIASLTSYDDTPGGPTAREVARHDKGQFTSAKPVPQQSLADLKAELEADLEGRPIEERDQMLHSAATQGLSSLDSIVQEIRARGNVATTCSEHSMNMSIGTSATAKSHYRKYAPGEGLGSDCTFTPRLGLTKKKTKEILGTSRANFANVADRLTYMGKSYEKRYEKLVHKHRTSRENAILRAQNAKKTLPKSDHLVHNVGTIGSRASRYMQRRSVSLDKKREELTRKQMRECTFHPQKISKASTSCDGASSSSSDPFYQRLAMHQQRREEKLRNALETQRCVLWKGVKNFWPTHPRAPYSLADARRTK